ncbi:unnamed protein product, partial [Phaeothamnion confervicola]
MRSWLCCFWCCCCYPEVDKDFSLKDDKEDKRTKKFKDILQVFKLRGDHGVRTGDDYVFSLVLNLFTLRANRSVARPLALEEEEEPLPPLPSTEDAAAISLITQELGAAYEREPDALEFYLPQLVTFLAIGGASSEEARAFWLELCGVDLRIAHRTQWYLAAFFAAPGPPGDATPALRSFEAEAQERGLLAASRLSRRLLRRRPGRAGGGGALG